MENLQVIKQRFGIIGNDIQLNRALEKAVRVSPTDISVLLLEKVALEKKIFLKLFINYHIENTQNILQ